MTREKNGNVKIIISNLASEKIISTFAFLNIRVEWPSG